MNGRRGTYKYTVWHHGTLTAAPYYTHHTLRVEVLEALPASYRVKYLGYHQNGRGPGHISTVRQKTVTLDMIPEEPNAYTPTDGIERDIRKPYKDD